MAAPNAKTVDEINASIAEILKSEDFRTSHTEASELTRSIGELFQELLTVAQHWILQIREIHPAFFASMVVIASLVLFYMAWWGLRRSIAQNIGYDSSTASSLRLAKTPSPGELRAQATRYAEAEDYLTGIRFLFRAFITEYEAKISQTQTSAFHEDTTTYSEYLLRLSQDLDFDPALERLLKTLERGLYGDELLNVADYQDACRILNNKEAFIS